MDRICENCAVVETLSKEQCRIEKYKDEIQSIRVKNRNLQAENEKLKDKIQAGIIAVKNGYGGDTYNQKVIDILEG